MKKDDNDNTLNLEFEDNEINLNSGPVTVLGRTFANDEERREYFREELRKKLPELKKIEGFPIGTDDDIIHLSDPPYYTACPNPWLNDFIAEWEQKKLQLEAEGKRQSNVVVTQPYAVDISEGKNNPIYNAHSYHTKVPHPAIRKLIEHYTQPGDIVYDGFAGTGMTGIACGVDFTCDMVRHAICSDLSPIASFIAYNLNINNSPDLSNFSDILSELEEEYGYLYETKHSENQIGIISHVVWSDIISCNNCGKEIRFWDAFVKYGEGQILNESHCPSCYGTMQRKSCKKVFETYFDYRLNCSQNRVIQKPVLISYKYKGKKYIKFPDEYDLEKLSYIQKLENNSWYPIDELPLGDKMGDPKAKGIFHIHQFYFERTLFILSKIWEKCSYQNRFFITNAISRNLTKLNRFIVNTYNPHGRINGPLAGTLYVPSEIVEQNVFELLYDKISNIKNLKFENIIQVGDALHTPNIKSESIDYIFTDPPFGANIMYSELNLISESWLKLKTNTFDEAIENKTQNKSVFDYGDLMVSAFKEYYRILKPGKWMTVEFSNTSAAVWNAIQRAISSAGFIIVSVSFFDKVHGGQKSMRYTTAVKQDLIISCFKPTEELLNKFENREPENNVWDFVDELLSRLPVHLEHDRKTTSVIERSPKILYDRMISFYVQKGYPVPINAQDFQKGLNERYAERDGMFFTPSQATKYEALRKKTEGFQATLFFVDSEQGGITWLNNELITPQTYQEIQPKWMQAINGVRKNDILPELMQILEENFIKEPDGKWRKPNLQDDVDLEALRHKSLMREFKVYVEVANKPKGKIKEARLEALRAGFKQAYQDKDFSTIVKIGDRIPQNLLTEDEQLLQFYEIASSRV